MNAPPIDGRKLASLHRSNPDSMKATTIFNVRMNRCEITKTDSNKQEAINKSESSADEGSV